MLEAPDGRPLAGIDALKHKLTLIRAQQPELEPGMVTEVIRAVLTTISDDLSTKEATLLREVEELDEIAILEDAGGVGVQLCQRW